MWTSELAEGLGDSQKALAARVAAFKAQPAMGDYQKALELAGAAAPAVRAELLQVLRQHQGWDSNPAKVDIFLQEGLLDDAIAAVKDLGYYQADLVKRVMAAALNERPDWVRANATCRAEEIMDAARSNAYHHAVEWLQQARAAYLASGQQAAWQAYRTRLMQLHARKYKLVGMLKQRDLV